MVNLINREMIKSFENVKTTHNYCHDALIKRRAEILHLFNDYPVVFQQCFKLNTDLRQPCNEVNKLITETEKNLERGIFENCESNLYTCIDTINKIMDNTEEQLQSVRKIRNGINDNQTITNSLNRYEARLMHELNELKIFRRRISKFTDYICY